MKQRSLLFGLILCLSGGAFAQGWHRGGRMERERFERSRNYNQDYGSRRVRGDFRERAERNFERRNYREVEFRERRAPRDYVSDYPTRRDYMVPRSVYRSRHSDYPRVMYFWDGSYFDTYGRDNWYNRDVLDCGHTRCYHDEYGGCHRSSYDYSARDWVTVFVRLPKVRVIIR